MIMTSTVQDSFRSVEQYPKDLLRMVDDGVQVAVTCKIVWDDGFGARGWNVSGPLFHNNSVSLHNQPTNQRDRGHRISAAAGKALAVASSSGLIFQKMIR